MRLNHLVLLFKLVACFGLIPAQPILADGHGVALFGQPALPPDYTHLPHVNPEAPTGGKFVDGQVGSFDSLNPHIQKGRTPWQLRFLAYESLLGRSYDEPFTLYGLLAEKVEIGPENDWVEFTLNPLAAFSDGTPVTVEDVLWSMETLGTEGHGRYRGSWGRVKSAEAVGERTVRFTLNEADRELAMIMGLRPILKKAQWDGVEFGESGLDTIPIATAPYVITDFEAGRFVELTRNPDYWGADIPFRRGTNQIDTVRMEFYGDATAMFEAFKAGSLTTIRETNAVKWAQEYDFPRVQSGEVVKSVIPHQRPSGMTGLVMNTRRDFFSDWRVREAMIHAFNFTYANQILTDGAQPRITSYFSNSPLSMQSGAATGKVAALLEPLSDDLLPGTLEGYTLPEGDTRVANRGDIRRATKLLEEAGYSVVEGQLVDPAGDPVSFEILLQLGSSEVDSIVDIYVAALERLGITPTVSTVDDAQYRERVNGFGFDMTWYRWGLSLSPGNEQKLYWGSNVANTPGSRNLMGVESPAIDALIEAMLSAPTQEDYVAAIRALDRTLTAGRYVIPIWHNPVSWIAHDARLTYKSDRLPIYGDWIGFQPDIWWFEK